MKETQAWDIRGRTGREGGCEREVWWRGGHERNEARVPRKHLSSSRSRSLSAAAAVFPWTFAILSARFRLILARLKLALPYRNPRSLSLSRSIRTPLRDGSRCWKNSNKNNNQTTLLADVFSKCCELSLARSTPGTASCCRACRCWAPPAGPANASAASRRRDCARSRCSRSPA